MDSELISSIIGLPLAGFSAAPFFTEKDYDTTLTNKMKEKYGLERDKIGFFIASINDDCCLVNE